MAARFDHLLPEYTDAELAAEEWKRVRVDGVVFPEYGVSSLGRVRNLKSGRLLKLLWCHALRGEASVYWRVCMSRGPKGGRGERGTRERKALLVHRLVAEAFVPGRTAEKSIVHHIDAVTYNPRASNLQWATPSENVRYGYMDRATREQEAAYHDSLRPSILDLGGDSAPGQDPTPPVLADFHTEPEEPCPF